ncbi:hypothetical protein EJB05_30463, partial [Eragrostis curvula]
KRAGMAELAVGLTKSVVAGALTKAQAAIEAEGKLRKSAQRDLVFITGEFQMMQAFLSVANEERVKNLVVMAWVRQIRELAFDVEDCIEFVVHLDSKSSDRWRRLLHALAPPCIPTAALPLDEAVDEIEQLKARVEDVSQRNARYSLISDTGSKPVVVEKPQQQQPAAAAVDATAAYNLLLDEERDAAAAKRQQQGDLTQFVTHKQDELQVISVWGTGGDAGTTSLIRKAYTDPEICATFACRAWVKLVHPFDPHEFVRCLMAQFYQRHFYGEEEAGACRDQFYGPAAVGVDVLKKMDAQQDLLGEFKNHVTHKRYLVVLQGLTSMVDWDAIRAFLPDMKNGSWIIVSTQQSEIARLCIGHSSQVLELRQFSAEHSVCAFFKEAPESEETDKASSSNNEMAGGHLFCPQGNGGRPPSNNNILDSATHWVENNPLVGRGSEMSELGKCVANTRYNQHQVCMSVWGIAGVGKSHLVRHLYYDKMLKHRQFEKYSWVNVSQSFSLRDFSWRLLLGFQSESPQSKETMYRRLMGSKSPIQECRELLKKHRCLVIIDDLQSKEQWDSIRDNLVTPSDSLIIAITTESSIAAHCADSEELVYNVRGLQADMASELFQKVHGNQTEVSSEIMQELILKCGGLPKVIVDIADLLNKKVVKRMDTARSINERFIHRLENSPEFDSLRDLFTWMRTYFRTCPDYLKPCIFYMSIFPQDYNIRRRRLVRRWIAEGYSRDTDDKSAEDNGEDFFSKLLDLSIIQQPPQQLVTTASYATRKSFCQVNGFIREYIVSRRMEENLVFELGDSSALTTQRIGRHLTIRRSWIRDKIVFGKIDFSRLRSLTVFGNWESFLISESMKLLRVLDLEDAYGVTDDDVDKMVKLLHRLKFLSLRRCNNIRRLPSSLGDLRQLQSLDVRHTSIVTLPVSITKLQQLQYIRAGRATNIKAEEPSMQCLSVPCRNGHQGGVKMPRGTEKLTALHTLGVVNIGASGGKDLLKELKELTQLRKLGVSGINKKNSKNFFSEISGLGHLESLFVHLDKGNGDCLDGMSLSMKNLQSLKLYGSLQKLPEGIRQLSMITKLDVEMVKLQPSDIVLLGTLPELSILRLKLVEGGHLKFCVIVNNVESSSFEKVSDLVITCSSSLHVTFGLHTMKKLELLRTVCCAGSSVELSGIENRGNVKIQQYVNDQLAH